MVARKAIVIAVSTAVAAFPPPGTAATTNARAMMIAILRSVLNPDTPGRGSSVKCARRSRAPGVRCGSGGGGGICSLRGHDDYAEHDGCGECSEGEKRQAAERHRARGTARSAHLDEPREAEDRDREDERHTDPREERVAHGLEQRLAVDDGSGQEAHAGTGAPWRILRAKAKAVRPSPMAETTMGPTAPVPKMRVMPYAMAPTAAAHGRVRTHAATMFPATPQRTADTRLPAPAPMIPPEITWVVESGNPKCEEARITAAPAPCAENPCAASILMIRVPIVLMIRQPPE